MFCKGKNEFFSCLPVETDIHLEPYLVNGMWHIITVMSAMDLKQQQQCRRDNSHNTLNFKNEQNDMAVGH